MSERVRLLLLALGVVAGFVVTFVVATGFWLVSLTDYPYLRTVGGATLIGGSVLAFFAVAIVAETIEDASRL